MQQQQQQQQSSTIIDNSNRINMENKLFLQQLKGNSDVQNKQGKPAQQQQRPSNDGYDNGRYKNANYNAVSNRGGGRNSNSYRGSNSTKTAGGVRLSGGAGNGLTYNDHEYAKDVLFDNDLLNEDGSGGGSKKQNLSHLLNFKYTIPRNPTQYDFDYETKMMKQFWSTKLNKASIFTKEQFLQANCQFTVSTSYDYSIHFADPDILVDWDRIEEIQINSHDDTIQCPICLCQPTATKMTKCGHIYCWCCILHYLALSDKSWRKCPICFESIYKNDLKSCKIIKHKEYKANDVIELNLMFRETGSTIALPASVLKQFCKLKPSDLKDYSRVEFDYAQKYMKLKTATQGYILDAIVKRERGELDRQLKENENEPEVCFINSAITLLDEREDTLRTKPDKVSTPVQVTVRPEVVPVIAEKQESVKYEDAFDDKAIEEATSPLATEPHEATPVAVQQACDEVVKENNDEPQAGVASKSDEQAESTPPVRLPKTSKPVKTSINQQDDFFYMYQSIDGQRVYMNSMNLRCLLHEYGTINNCPLQIQARIVHIDCMFMNEDLRRRYKYLSHLPLHSDFKMVELELCEPLVSKDTLAVFEKEIEAKRASRTQKEREELRRLKRYENSINSSQQNQPYYTNYSDFDCGSSKADAMPIDYNEAFPIIIDEEQQKASGSPSTQQQQYSFAQMLKHETAANNELLWPKLATTSPTAMPRSSADNEATPWGKPQMRTKVLSKSKNDDEDDVYSGCADEDGYVPGYQESFMLAIDHAIQSAKLSNAGVGEDAKTPDSNKSKKKKKTKNLLFSTSLNFRN